MIVDIQTSKNATCIFFLGCNYTDDLIPIICGMAGLYCFEPNAVNSDDFYTFTQNLVPDKRYFIRLETNPASTSFGVLA